MAIGATRPTFLGPDRAKLISVIAPGCCIRHIGQNIGEGGIGMRSVLAALSMSALLLTACQQSQPTGTEAAATFCGDLRAFNRTVAAMGVTTGATTVGEYKQRMKAVDDSWDALKESAKAVPQARTNDLENAYNDLKKTVNGVSDSASLTDAGQTVQPKVQEVSKAREQVGSGVR